MKIAFWGPETCKGHVTANMVCMSAALALDNAGKILLFENHAQLKSVASMVMPEHRAGKLRENAAYMQKYGVDHVIKQIFRGMSGREAVKEVYEKLFMPGLYYMPQCFVPNKEAYAYQMGAVGNKLYDEMEESCDYLFTDAQTNNNTSTTMVLSDADIVVVNLTCDMERVEWFFENEIYASLRDKAFYLFNTDGERIDWLLMKIAYTYKVNKKRMGIIPRDLEVEDALRSGKLLYYINKYYLSTGGQRGSDFSKRLRGANKNLISYISEVQERKLSRMPAESCAISS